MAGAGQDQSRAPVAFGLRAVPQLFEELREPDTERRKRALNSLCDLLHDPERLYQTNTGGFVSELKPLLQDSDPAVRRKTCDLLHLLTAHSIGRRALLSSALLAPLSLLLDDPDVRCRIRVLRVLKRLLLLPSGAEALLSLVPKLMLKLRETVRDTEEEEPGDKEGQEEEPGDKEGQEGGHNEGTKEGGSKEKTEGAQEERGRKEVTEGGGDEEGGEEQGCKKVKEEEAKEEQQEEVEGDKELENKEGKEEGRKEGTEREGDEEQGRKETGRSEQSEKGEGHKEVKEEEGIKEGDKEPEKYENKDLPDEEEELVLLLSTLASCSRLDALPALASDGVSLLRHKLTHRSRDVRREAAAAMMALSVSLEGKRQVCSQDVLSVLMDLLRDSETEVRANAAGVFMNAAVITTGKTQSLDLGLIPVLLDIVSSEDLSPDSLDSADPDQSTRRKALVLYCLRALTSLSEAPAARALLLEWRPLLERRKDQDQDLLRATQTALRVIDWTP